MCNITTRPVVQRQVSRFTKLHEGSEIPSLPSHNTMHMSTDKQGSEINTATGPVSFWVGNLLRLNPSFPLLHASLNGIKTILNTKSQQRPVLGIETNNNTNSTHKMTFTTYLRGGNV